MISLRLFYSYYLHRQAVYPTMKLYALVLTQKGVLSHFYCDLAKTSALVLITKRKNYHE